MAKHPVKNRLLAKGLALTRKRGKASRDEIEERRRIVIRMRLQGKSFKEIAGELGVNYHTVKKDFETTRKDFQKRVKNFNETYEIGKTLTVYEQVEEEAWRQFHKSTKAGEKEKLLNTIRSARNDHVKLLMDTGLINKAAKKVSHEVNAAQASLKDWTKDDQMLVTLALIQSRMKQQLKDGGNGVPLPGNNGRKMLDLPQDAIREVPFESEEN